MTEVNEAVEARLKSLRRGERFAYHVGFLAKDRQFSYELNVTARLVWEAYEKGRVTLFQQRANDNAGFVYYLARL